MKTNAVWFSAERTVEIREETLPEMGEESVLAQTLVSGISHGTELTVYRGLAPSKTTALDLDWDYFTPSTLAQAFANRFPIKYAYNNVARVIEAGASSGYKPGDIVFARSAHQDYIVEHKSWLTPLPNDIPSPAAATTLGLVDVAVGAMLDWPIVVGDVVFVSGLGLVGLFTLQLAKRTASVVVAVDPLPARREMALRLGADYAVSPQEALETIRKASKGQGADVVIECSGAPAALQMCIEAAGREAAVVVPAFYGLKDVPLVLSPEFHMRRLKIISSSVKEVDGRLGHRWTYARRFDVDISLLGPLHANEMISHQIDFRDAASAYKLIDEHPEDVLSVVLTYGADA
jgi:threonine dehydrogenase-like Zn-dependent dehydrogenase